MTVVVTKEDRLALIKAVAERRKKMAAIKAKSNATRKAAVKARSSRKKSSLEEQIKKADTHNINAYTDASKYAKTYYGSIAYETTRFDNDWD